ncbi:tetratricopeptide repeat protein [Flavobacterium jejuense]|uniref:Tetratricopeptide repeat protein n=1 Tax=Flavobacterium jejuense TaxID=1544455 RepID=A0ABX0IXT6_9FLAO|nr:tetratricopeptide repeat protein [Flavobacterium jejuense]NHN26589.1 tetratricopeptide repeat protein [Flavobacterium jejuense]
MKKGYLLFALFVSQIVCTQNFKLADSLLAVGQFDKAIESYQKETHLNKYFKIAKAFEAKGNTKEAYLSYQNYLKKDSLNQMVNYNYGLMLIELAKFKEAQICFNQLVKTNENPTFYYYLGLSYEKQNAISEALYHYQKSSKLDSLYFKSNYKLAVLLINQKKIEEAKKICTRFLNENQEDIEMLKLRAQINYVQENYNQAIIDFNQLLLLGQTETFILDKLAKSYYEKKEYQRSSIIFSTLIDELDEASYYFYRGKCYGFLNELEKAEVDIKTSIELKSFTFENEYFYLGYFYQRKKNFKKALYYYRKAIKEDKNHLEANYQILIIKDYLGNSNNEMLKEYQLFLKKFPSLAEEKKQYLSNRINQLKEK